MRRLFILGLLYKETLPSIIVMTVATDVYICGYENGLRNTLHRTKKPFLENIANMVKSTAIGTAKAVFLPIYMPTMIAMHWMRN